MNNQNNLKKPRNSKKLRSFGAICEGIHAKLARNPGTRNFVGFAAVVVLALVVWSFASPNDAKETQLKATRQIIMPMADSYTYNKIYPKTTTTLSGHKNPELAKFSVNNLRETEDTIICTVGSYLYAHHKGKTVPLPMELPKNCLAEYGGTPGPPVKAAVFLTLSRAVRFPDGHEMPAGTTIKAVKWPEQNDPDVFTFLTEDKTAWEISGKCIAELEGTPGEPEKARPGNLELPLPDLQRMASIREIFESIKSGSALTDSARETGEKIKKTYNEQRYVSEVDTLKEIGHAVTTPESFSLRPNFEKLNIRPRKATNAENCCVVHAVSVALEYLYKKDGTANGRLSLAYLRWLDPMGPRGGGHLTTMTEEASTKGVCLETEFPLTQMGRTPSADIQKKANIHKGIVVHGASSWKLGFPEFPLNKWGKSKPEIVNQIIMHEIKEGRPVLLGCHFPMHYDEGDMTQKYYIRSVPHAVLVVGYNTKDGTVANTTYEFLNSKGENWGYQGYGIWNAKWMMGDIAYSLSLE